MTFIKMYSADWCYDCKAMISLFEKKNIAYEVIHVDRDPTAVEQLKELCGGKKIIPTLEVNGRVLINPSIDQMVKLLPPDNPPTFSHLY